VTEITWHIWPDDQGDDCLGRAAEVENWWLEVFPADDTTYNQEWIWQASVDAPAGPYLTAREVLGEGYAGSMEEAQAAAIKAMQDQEFAWAEMETPPDWRREARLAQEARQAEGEAQ